VCDETDDRLRSSWCASGARPERETEYGICALVIRSHCAAIVLFVGAMRQPMERRKGDTGLADCAQLPTTSSASNEGR
jgi:hypothetical protein